MAINKTSPPGILSPPKAPYPWPNRPPSSLELRSRFRCLSVGGSGVGVCLPAVSFVICLGMAGWLWTRQSTVTHGWGEVYSPLVELNAPVAGELIAADQQPPRLYDFVESGAATRFDQQRRASQSGHRAGHGASHGTPRCNRVRSSPWARSSFVSLRTRATTSSGMSPAARIKSRSKRRRSLCARRGRDPREFATTIEEVGPAGAAPKSAKATQPRWPTPRSRFASASRRMSICAPVNSSSCNFPTPRRGSGRRGGDGNGHGRGEEILSNKMPFATDNTDGK